MKMPGIPRFDNAFVQAKAAYKLLLRGRVPGQLVIQLSDVCNASCPQCGLRASADFARSTLAVDEVKRIIEAAAERGVVSLSITGGEPFLHREKVFELISFARSCGIRYTRTGTNGFLFRGWDRPGWEQRIHGLAQDICGSGLYTFWISLDSADPIVHEKMRGLPGVVRGIEKALPIFGEYGVYPAANLGINRNLGGPWAKVRGSRGRVSETEHYDIFTAAFDRFYRFVLDLGFTIANSCYPMSVEEESEHLSAVYGATSSEELVRFTRTEKAEVFRALFETIPHFRHRLRIFTPLSSLASLVKSLTEAKPAGYACPGGADYFFVSARDGNTYPCGYRGDENLGKFYDLDDSRLDQGASCRLCEWECFRDPGELFGPLTKLLCRPFKLADSIVSDPGKLRLWKSDLAYYRACSYFDCRKDINLKKLLRYKLEADRRSVETKGTLQDKSLSRSA